MAFELEHQGRTYEWDDGQWFDTTRHMVAPEGKKAELNAAFIRKVELPGFVSELGADTKRFLFDLLRQKMGVSLEKLCSIGFFQEVLLFRPDLAIANVFSEDSRPQGRSFANCKRLRDRFFKGKTATPFTLPVRLIGNGPFERPELETFLKACGVALWKRNTPVHALILGRAQWDKEVVNEIIEEAEGTVLRIYSQEMLVAVLAGHPDPFQTLPLTERLWDLYAFRDGHPGLEYVSNGWAGWVKGVGSSEPIAWNEGTSEFTQVEQSPLVVMGYRVGMNGVEEESRRQILRSAFDGPLPFVESPGYMETWGPPASAERLKRIAQQLVNSIDSHRNMPNHQVAVSHWKDDLAWLKEKFYRGIYAFYWPQI
jgi:hypothetical protein